MREQPGSSTERREPTALRIGVMTGGRIIEEHIVRDRTTVTVGQGEKNTILVVNPRVPARVAIFESRGGVYHLNVKPFMRGRVRGSSGIVDLDGSAPRRIPLDDRSRGKIVVGDSTLLFQFVVPPRLRPRPQLPSSVRGAWLGAGLSLFMAAEGFIGWVWAASLACSVGLVVFFHAHDWPVQEEGLRVTTVYEELLVQPPASRDQADPDVAADGQDGVAGERDLDDEQRAADGKQRDQAAEHRGHGAPSAAEQKAAAKASREARIGAALEQTALLQVLGSLSGSDQGGGADMLRGSNVSSDIDEVLAKVGTVKTGSTSDTASTLGGAPTSSGPSQVASLDGPGAGEAVTQKVEVGPAKEKGIKAVATAKAAEEVGGAGILDPSGVNKVVKKNMTALRNCYEKGLRQNPTLEGKIAVKFTINPNGRVSSAAPQADSVGDPQVTSCVLGKFKGMTFDKPSGGSVTYVFPIVFKSAK